MRFIITARQDEKKSSPDAPFDEKLFATYMRFNEEMQKAGVLIAAEGLLPGAPGARVGISGGKRQLLDGPFTESKELVGGFYSSRCRRWRRPRPGRCAARWAWGPTTCSRSGS